MLFITLNQIRLSVDKCATRKYQVRVLSNKTTTERLQRTNTNYDLLVPLSKSWDNWVRNICLSYKRNRKALHSKSIFWDTPRISRTSLLFSIFRFSSFACIQVFLTIIPTWCVYLSIWKKIPFIPANEYHGLYIL